jgi:transcriptional regulator of acetoin/glycerol metabolism
MPETKDDPRLMSLDDALRIHVLRVLEACNFSQARAARVLGVNRKTVYRMMERWNIDVAAARAARR